MNYEMVNVVWYDGVDAYVTKYIVRKDTATEDLNKFFENTDGRVCYIDELYDLTKEEVLAILRCNSKEWEVVTQHYMEMYL